MTEWNRETIWRQGHFLGDAAIEALKLPNTNAQEKIAVIVATHDCDLSQTIDTEPSLEIVAGCLIDKVQGNFTHTKSPRRLHIELQLENGNVTFAEFFASNKLIIPKAQLVKHLPNKSQSLDVDNLNIFQRWLALRYRRSAFPDEFENRLKSKPNKLDEKISNILRKRGASITAIFFNVDDGKELKKIDANDTYTLDNSIIFGDKPDYNTAENEANEAREEVRNLFTEKLYAKESHAWVDIELRDCEAISEHALTYKQSTLLKQWRLEYISFAAIPAQETIE